MNTIVNITGLTLKCLETSDENAIKKAKKIEYHKQWYLKNKENRIKAARNWQKENIVKFINNRKNYWQKNKDRLNTIQRSKYKKNKDKINLLRRERRKIDKHYRILNILRVRINQALNNKYKKSKKTTDLIGISVEGLIKHIESTFKPGMSWEKRHLIHIDHIRPCSSFDLSKPEEQAKCFHYTNLQALWAHENLSKSDKFVA